MKVLLNGVFFALLALLLSPFVPSALADAAPTFAIPQAIQTDQIYHKYYTTWWDNENGKMWLQSYDPDTGELVNIGVIPGVKTNAQGEGTYDAENGYYVFTTNLGLTVVDIKDASVVNRFPPSLLAYEYSNEKKVIYGIREDVELHKLKLSSIDLKTNELIDIGILPFQVNSVAQGESTFDQVHGYYIFHHAGGSVVIVDTRDASIVKSFQFLGNAEYDPVQDLYFGIVENLWGEDLSLASFDLKTGEISEIGTIQNIKHYPQGISTYDPDHGYYMFKGLTNSFFPYYVIVDTRDASIVHKFNVDTNIVGLHLSPYKIAAPAKDIFNQSKGGSNPEYAYKLPENVPQEKENSNLPNTYRVLIDNNGGSFSAFKVLVKLPDGIIPDGYSSCHLSIQVNAESNIPSGFTTGVEIYNISIRCELGYLSTFTHPITVCLLPEIGSTNNMLVFHQQSPNGAYSPLPLVSGSAGYVCGTTNHLSNFTLGNVSLPNTGFAPDRETSLSDRSKSLAYLETSLTLIIPKLGLEMPIVGVPLAAGGWDTTWLYNQAGYLETTAFPTQAGNTVLTGHVWDANNIPGPLVYLSDLQYSDQIIISAWGMEYTYEVRTSRLVSSWNMSVMGHKDLDWVTLITCEGFNESSNSYLYRRAVQAVLVGVK
ncbi:MAG: class F sortase [Anaerolineales bacterium]